MENSLQLFFAVFLSLLLLLLLLLLLFLLLLLLLLFFNETLKYRISSGFQIYEYYSQVYFDI